MLTLKEAQYLVDLELTGWTIKEITSGGGLCVYGHKEIWIDHNHMNIPFILHEITHAKVELPPKDNHNVTWGDTYTAMMERYFGHLTFERLKEK